MHQRQEKRRHAKDQQMGHHAAWPRLYSYDDA
jgi:hypothetical protein